jgi:hypothetical protein
MFGLGLLTLPTGTHEENRMNDTIASLRRSNLTLKAGRFGGPVKIAKFQVLGHNWSQLRRGLRRGGAAVSTQ